MIFAITIFYISLLALLLLVLAKQREEATGASKILDSINTVFERRLRTISFVVGASVTDILVPGLLHLIRNFTHGIISGFVVLFRQAKRELADVYSFFVNRVQLDKIAHRRGAVSFFLKDIADYKKNNLSSGKRSF